MSSIELNLNGNGNISIFNQGSEVRLFPDSVAMSPSNSNLIYLFDPLYYNGYIKSLDQKGVELRYTSTFLQRIFDKYSSIIPSSQYVVSKGYISNKTDDPQNLKRKGKLNGPFFSYEKSSDDSDIPVGRGNDYRGPSKGVDATGEKERKKALLKLIDPKTNGVLPIRNAVIPLAKSSFNLLEANQSKTFSCFIKLNDPVKHKSTNSGKVIRGKKAIFLDTTQFTIGYRSPYYLYRPSQRIYSFNTRYKYKFEPFSFVFSIKDKDMSHTFMTDFKYEFGKTYHLAITTECGSTNSLDFYQAPLTVKVYINGEQQNTAYLKFNPLIRGNEGSSGSKSRSKRSRLENSPVQPNFHKINGTNFTPISNTQTVICKPLGKSNTNPRYGPNILYLGKSNLVRNKYNFHNTNNDSRYSSYLSKRYLNNIDVGVIQIYNIALSQNQINSIYNNFGIRYQ
jgi:hypothetical protein